MKKTLLTVFIGFALSSGAYSQQIVEQTYPIAPVSPVEQQIMAVQQAEQEIRTTEQAIALQKAQAAERQAKINAQAAAKRRAAQAKINAEKKAKQAEIDAQRQAAAAEEKNYNDQMKQIDLEMKKLDLELKRSQVKTQIDMNDVAQQKARMQLEKEAAALKQSSDIQK